MSDAAAEPWEGLNYFNYFTEIEEHFRRARGSGLFLLSPLDWALIETWKESGVPLEAVLRGIDEAFTKWRAKKSKTQMVNSVAFCAQAVLTIAKQMADPEAAARQARPVSAPFELEELRAYLADNATAVGRRPELVFAEISAALERLADESASHYERLEDLERHLAALEDKMIAAARALQSEADLVAARREFDIQLRPYRGKMTAEQIAMMERQFLDRRILESAALPRLSLFFLR